MIAGVGLGSIRMDSRPPIDGASSRASGRTRGAMPDALTLPWRVGEHYDIHLYAQVGDGVAEDDIPLGTMLRPEWAAEAAAAHNARLREAADGDS
jgi:hypothetical protein